jgi:hypothetical protein
MLQASHEGRPIAIVDLHVHCPEEKKCKVQIVPLPLSTGAVDIMPRLRDFAKDYVVRALECELAQ